MNALPEAWRLGVTAEGSIVEARRLADDTHPFGGVVVQGSLDHVRAAAWLLEVRGWDYRSITPLRRRPRVGGGGGLIDERRSAFQVRGRARDAARRSHGSCEHG